MSKVFFPLFMLMCFQGTFAQSQFTGTYTNEYLNIVLASGQQQQLSGSVTSNEGTFDLVASVVNNNSISGTYSYYGQNIPFTGQLQQNQLIIDSQGQQIILQKQGAMQQTSSIGNTSLNNAIEKEDAWGMTFSTPADWNTQLADGVRYFVSPDQKKIIMLVPDTESTSLQDLHNGAKDGLVEGNTQLLPAESSSNFDNDGVAVPLTGVFNGRQAKGYVIGRLSPYQSGAIVVGVSETADYSTEFQQQVTQFAKQIQFFAPIRAATNSNGTENIDDWGTYMKGRKLVYMKSETGFYMKISLYLCSDGSFRYTDNSGGFGGGASIAADAGYTGKWQAYGKGNSGTLVLNYNDGSSKTYNTELGSDGLYLNGTRYFRDTNDLCN